jgi:hypothetical protein
MRIKLNCLACGHQMELSEAYEDYQGEVRCWVCRTVLEVALREGKLRSIRKSTGDLSWRDQEAGTPQTRPPEPDQVPAAVEQETK